TQAASLEAILEEEGYKVRVAQNGRAGLAEVRSFQPALVISDVVMPEMGGFEMCKLIKGDDHAKNILVILLTSLIDPLEIISGLDAGADNFITKPYRTEHLLSRVSSLLSSRALRKDDRTEQHLQLSFMGKP